MPPVEQSEFAEQFPPLFGLGGPTNISVDVSAFAPILLLLVFACWAIFSLACAYHWFKYAHSSWVAVPALGVHVFVSGFLLVYALAGLA